MDILIKNIGGLPEDGDLTLTITPKGQVILGGCIFTSNFGKEVKAVALPPHGDLIDRKELLRFDNISYVDTGYWSTDYEAVKTSVIKKAPTIVEANNG